MKTMKKLFALLLALTMVFGLAATGYAAAPENGENGTIVVKDALKGVEYTAYRIFDLESISADGKNISYTVTNGWENFVTGDNAPAKEWIKLENGYVTWVGEESTARVEAFIDAALTYAAANATAIADATYGPLSVELGEDEVVDEDVKAEIKFENLPLGYYLVETSLGALCSLDTNIPDVEIKEKNDIPPVEKKVEEEAGFGAWGDNNDAAVGETVNFKATITVVPGYENYKLHDNMDGGLTSARVSKVTLQVMGSDGNLGAETDMAAGDYTVSYPTAPAEKFDDGCNFEVAINKDLKTGDVVTVYYSAIVDTDAVVGGAGNVNNAEVEYGDGNHTEKDPTVTKTFKIDVFKFYGTTADGSTEVTQNPLAGATFQLSKTAPDQNGKYTAMSFHEVTEHQNYRNCELAECATATDHKDSITTDATGKFTITGLDEGTYYLIETDAPEGYNKLANPIVVVIDDNGAVTVDGEDLPEGDVEVDVENKTGTELPSTGGMGTTLFYVFGSIMMVGAAVLLIAKKRTNI